LAHSGSAACKTGIEDIIPTDARGHDGLADIGFDKRFRVNRSDDEFVKGTNHVDGIESFWSFEKRRPAKSNAIARHTFASPLKACESRFNHRFTWPG
jgi:hypothetical protein